MNESVQQILPHLEAAAFCVCLGLGFIGGMLAVLVFRQR